MEVIAVANERVLHVVDDMTHADETSKKSKRNKGFRYLLRAAAVAEGDSWAVKQSSLHLQFDGYV